MILETVLLSMPLADLKAMISETVTAAVKKASPSSSEPFKDYPELLTRGQTAQMFGICLATLDNWTKQGKLQKIKNGKVVRYNKTEVLKAFASLQKFQRG